MNFLLLFLALGSTSIDDYVISVGDELLISVYGSISISYAQTVTSNGEIFIQYVSTPPDEESPFIKWQVLDVITVAGKSVRDATIMLKEGFSRYFRDITVNLSVISFRARVYTAGAVEMPGAYPFLPDLRGLDYIGISGGPSERANMKGAYILTKEGEKLPITDHPPMYSTVMVPELGLKWWQDYVTIASALTAIIITWLTVAR